MDYRYSRSRFALPLQKIFKIRLKSKSQNSLLLPSYHARDKQQPIAAPPWRLPATQNAGEYPGGISCRTVDEVKECRSWTMLPRPSKRGRYYSKFNFASIMDAKGWNGDHGGSKKRSFPNFDVGPTTVQRWTGAGGLVWGAGWGCKIVQRRRGVAEGVQRNRWRLAHRLHATNDTSWLVRGICTQTENVFA